MVYYDHRHEAKSYTSDIEKDMYAFLSSILAPRREICILFNTRVLITTTVLNPWHIPET